ncbi:MAG: LacI family DNA-binding transcriptional regulator [Erysipelotrichales bacterium]|nr:LacI family DNA-binding transcriptional regulator [Erysipelotrichales bacterium]
MVTIYDIAKHCNCAPSTVSKVLNGYEGITPSTKEKVKKAIKELNYIPNVGAISLSKAKSHNIGILSYYDSNISTLNHAFFVDISHHFQDALNAKKYDILFVSRNVLGKEETYYRNAKSRNIAGVLLYGDMNQKEMIEMMEGDVPCVSFDYLGDLPVSSVSSDNAKLMEDLTEYVLENGHTNIAYISGGKTSAVSDVRYMAFYNTLKRHNIPWDESRYYESKFKDEESMRALVKNILTSVNRPTVIMCQDDYDAATAIQVINEMGLRCPEDVSVTGFDGVEISKYTSPVLTTAKQDSEKIGQALSDLLLEKLNNSSTSIKRIVIPGTIVKGKSVYNLKK